MFREYRPSPLNIKNFITLISKRFFKKYSSMILLVGTQRMSGDILVITKEHF